MGIKVEIAGGAFIVRGRTPVIGNLTDFGNLVPPTPIGVLPVGVIGPIVIDYNITFDTLFVGPNIVGSGLFYEENLDTKITVISTDGCQIRQESLLVTVLHEER